MKIIDNILSTEQTNNLYNRFINEKYSYGETDNDHNLPTGLIHEITDNALSNYLGSIASKEFEVLNSLTIYRAYVNLFIPRELPYFHRDGQKVITCLFYINPQYELDEGGETQFIIENKLIAVESKPGRLAIFDGNLLHRATSFRTYPRLTIAIKYDM